MIILGIDPGLSGALALYDHAAGKLDIHDCPLADDNGKKTMFLPGIAMIIAEGRIGKCVIERAQAMPKQGVSGMFNYGRGYGCYLGILAALKVPYDRVTPQVWKKSLNVPSDKDATRARASELLPAHSQLWMRKKDHGRAEAALIAYYGATRLNA